MRVLIGYDASRGSRDAVELGRWLAAGEGGEALLLDVLAHPGPLPVAYYILGYEEAPWAEEFFRQPASVLAPLEVRWRTYTGGSPAHVLTDVAGAEGFELIVVGSPHRGAVGRALLGSVAQGVLHGAPVPVAVAPRGFADERHPAPRRIGVACDGSPEAAVALAQAEALARRHGAALELLTVATGSPIAPGLVGFRLDPIPTPDEALAESLAAVGSGVEASGRELHGGSVAAALAAAAEDLDLLVVGSRGYGFFARVMVGSVSSELIQAAPCPVLVTPRPEDKAGG
ncbi:MAG: universal stress protein [Solirubrobacterales bacterium]